MCSFAVYLLVLLAVSGKCASPTEEPATTTKRPEIVELRESNVDVGEMEEGAGDERAEFPRAVVSARPVPKRQCIGNIFYRSSPNFVFYGTLLGSYKSLGEQACADLCYQHPYCETANFIMESYVCELNAEARIGKTQWYRHRNGVNYLEDIYCKSAESYLEEMCKPPERIALPWFPVVQFSMPMPRAELCKQSAQGTCGQSLVTQRLSSAGIDYAINPRLSFTRMTEARPHSYPWAVSLQRDRLHICTGVLISEFDIITSASCFAMGANPRAYKAALGAHSISSNDPGQQVLDVSAIAIHDRYNPSWSRENDLALVRLARSAGMTTTNNIRPACLPRTDAVWPEMCVTVGWGRISGSAGVDRLSQIVAPAIGRTICNKPEWYNREVSSSMLCAGYRRATPCQPDIGGPLICQLNGTWSIYGVSSWGEGCARTLKPAVYTNVAYFTSWIRSKITLNSKK